LANHANAQSTEIEYFYMPGCQDCELTDPLIKNISEGYHGYNITIEWADVTRSSNLLRWEKYGFTEVPALVINGSIKISKENLTEENLKLIIVSQLALDTLSNTYYQGTGLTFIIALSMGLFSGFSPCLMAILGFILVYNAGSVRNMKDSMGRALVFGIGLTSAYILLGMILLVSGKSLMGAWGTSIVAGIVSIIIGLNMLGVFNLPVKIDDYLRRTTRKYVGSWTGLFFLGILFSMVKVPCAAPFLLVLIDQALAMTTLNSILLLLTFAVGVMMPFIIIGLIGGYTSTVRVRSYRSYIKTISGIIIILLGFWIMI
jgi:cytochrome c biogenesis protein CcdA